MRDFLLEIAILGQLTCEKYVTSTLAGSKLTHIGGCIHKPFMEVREEKRFLKKLIRLSWFSVIELWHGFSACFIPVPPVPTFMI
jgi:hypothetical protein